MSWNKVVSCTSHARSFILARGQTVREASVGVSVGTRGGVPPSRWFYNVTHVKKRFAYLMDFMYRCDSCTFWRSYRHGCLHLW